MCLATRQKNKQSKSKDDKSQKNQRSQIERKGFFLPLLFQLNFIDESKQPWIFLTLLSLSLSISIYALSLWASLSIHSFSKGGSGIDISWTTSSSLYYIYITLDFSPKRGKITAVESHFRSGGIQMALSESLRRNSYCINLTFSTHVIKGTAKQRWELSDTLIPYCHLFFNN